MRNGKKNYSGGVIIYFKDDFYHRKNGPAKIWPDGYSEWWLNGKLHREDGPAIVGGGDTRASSYWMHGVSLTEKEFIKWKLLDFMK